MNLTLVKTTYYQPLLTALIQRNSHTTEAHDYPKHKLRLLKGLEKRESNSQGEYVL